MTSIPHADHALDLGDVACGERVNEIAPALDKLQQGQTLLVIARDPAAIVDITAWCRTTGNPLLEILPDGYSFLIKKAS